MINSVKETKKAVIYARHRNYGCSNDLSIEYQISDGKKYAEDNGYTIVGVYSDKEYGYNRNRPAFRKMIRDTKDGNFNTVLIFHHDRFARRLAEYKHYEDILRENGVNLIVIPSETNAALDTLAKSLSDAVREHRLECYSNEAIDNNPTGQFISNLIAAWLEHNAS